LILFRTFLLILSFACDELWAGGEAKLKIGDHSLTVELAESPNEQMTGLMNRESLESNHGMLFIFPNPKKASFWMHNTSIPLDLAFLNTDGVILEIHSLVPFEETPVVSKSDQVAYALEVNRDWFASRGLKPGIKVKGLPKS
jgi:uncharacterized membrane protein (UPF0127 family)